MPHIGALAAHLDRRNSSKIWLVFTFLGCLICFYFMFGSCYFYWTLLLFPSLSASGINDLYFFYVNMVEFVVFLFIRTRSSIKYFPKLITLLNLCFLLYINSYVYSA